MVTCTRKGCGKEFDPQSTNTSECSFHPGSPVFHEGLKSWSCCKDLSGHKPVTDFTEFMAIPGCATGSHSQEKPVEAPKPQPVPAPVGQIVDGKEVFGGAAKRGAPPPKDNVKPKSTEYVEENDDSDIEIAIDTACKRRACGARYEGSRVDEVCVYHPGAPIFHEGSKGYSCCKPRTLDFDDFMKIKGCRTGKHLFVGPKVDPETQVLVDCRTDHYQTPTQVIMSVFGKGSNKEKSSIVFTETTLQVDLFLPDSKRFTKEWTLYGPIIAEKSTFKILGTKVELVLAKADGRSWPSIAALSSETNFIPQLAFSAGGGRGTVGAKDMVLDSNNSLA